MASKAAPPAPLHRRRWLRIAAGTAAGLAVFLALVALLLPGYLKGMAVEQIREQLRRDATIDSITINPLTLSARVRALAIMDSDGKSELLGIDELYARISPTSLAHFAPIIADLSVERPRIHLARLAPERYNISDILERLAARPASPDRTRFELNNLRIADGAITFDDRPAGKVHRIEQLQVGIPVLSSLPADGSEPAEPTLAATVNGRPMSLRGKTKPFANSLETTVHLQLTDLDVPTYVAYSPAAMPLSLDRGRLSAALDISLLRAPSAGFSVRVAGTARLDDVELRERGSTATASPVAAVRAIEVSIGELRWPQNTLHIDRLSVSGPQLQVRREAAGQLNWERLFPPAKAGRPAPTAPSSSWTYALDLFELNDGVVQFDDVAAPTGFRTTIKPVNVWIRNLSSVDGARATFQAALATDASEMFGAIGSLSLSPLAIAAAIDARQIKVQRYRPYIGAFLAGELDGTIDLRSHVVQDAADGLIFAGAQAVLTGVSVRNAAKSEVAKASLALNDVDVVLDRHSVAIGGIALRDCRAILARDSGGHWNFDTLLKTRSEQPVRGAAAAPPAASPSATDWKISLQQAKIGCAVNLDDRLPPGGSKVRLDPVELRADNWSTVPGARGRFDMKATVNRTGRIAARGTASMLPLAAQADLEVERLDLVPLQAYAADRLNVRFASGALSTRGKLVIDPGEPLAVRYRGELGIAKLASSTKADGEDFLNWEGLRIGGLNVAVNAALKKGDAKVPLAVQIDEVGLSDFYSRLIVNPDGTLNVQQILVETTKPAPAQESAAVVPPASSSTKAPATPSTKAPATPAPAIVVSTPMPAPAPPASAIAPVTIGRVTLTGGRVNFSDHFVKPNYSANLQDVNGTVAGLSSDAAARATVDIHGRYDPSAPVEIKGTINPLRGNLFLDLAVNCRDIELVPFTPYAQKYAGYGITKGKLSFEVKYQIDDRKLSAENKLLVDQLTFGDRVESPDATKLPVLLAVSLLKNARGEIDLNLPISGSLDDPQFSVFALVVKVIVNLLVKAATSPFALIGGLMGGSEDLAYIDFTAGAATLAAGQDDKLGKIAKALIDRPALKLEIAGRSDAVADSEPLRRNALQRRLAALRQEEQIARGEASESVATMTIPPADYPRLLKRAMEAEKISAAKSAPVAPVATAGQTAAKPPAEMPVADMEQLLLARMTIGPEDLRDLAERRAGTAKELLGKAGIAGERMFIIATGEAAGGAVKSGPRVDFTLK